MSSVLFNILFAILFLAVLLLIVFRSTRLSVICWIVFSATLSFFFWTWSAPLVGIMQGLLTLSLGSVLLIATKKIPSQTKVSPYRRRSFFIGALSCLICGGLGLFIVRKLNSLPLVPFPNGDEKVTAVSLAGQMFASPEVYFIIVVGLITLVSLICLVLLKKKEEG